METCPDIETAISQSTGKAFEIANSTALSGGSISQSQKLKSRDGREFFCKQNEHSFYSYFDAESTALKQIEETNTIRVPKVISLGRTPSASFLVLEYIEEGSSNAKGQEEMGRQLARMHKIPQPYYGWTQDNCIGATPQPNPKSENWIDFYGKHRLQHQLQLAAQRGRSFDQAEKLLLNLEYFFESYDPQPALLHGDLWGGNASHDSSGDPFIYDPATYYGDRETDLAFTYMFGGFSSSFYQGYEKEYPLDKGFKIRKTLYNLYHELNHFNLFGGGYASSAQSSINQLVTQLP